jgi:hypothetical protein
VFGQVKAYGEWLISPWISILPGKVEAWRRFGQELEGSRLADFEAWCSQCGLHLTGWHLYDTPGGAIIFLQLQIADVVGTLTAITNGEMSFQSWLQQQILTLHGLDLQRFSQAIQRTEWNARRKEL